MFRSFDAIDWVIGGSLLLACAFVLIALLGFVVKPDFWQLRCAAAGMIFYIIGGIVATVTQ